MPELSERRYQTREQLALLDRRTWHLWALSLTITLSLAGAIAAFFYPVVKRPVDRIETLHGILPQLILGLLVLVVLQSAYIITKQRELSKMRDFIIATLTGPSMLIEKYPKDLLTGVLDRRALSDVLALECSWVDRYQIPLCLALSDIRGFGKVNESEGHMVGDLVLKDLAHTIQTVMRQLDTVLRHGADEFLCLLPRTDQAGGQAFTRRVAAACQSAGRLRGLTLDFGIAVYKAGLDSDQVLAEVERNVAAEKSPEMRVTSAQPADQRAS